MTVKHTCAGVVILGMAAFLAGCQSTLQTAYNPTYTPSFSTTAKGHVMITAISDKRNTKPGVYYQNSSNGDTGQFAKPVADLVREALAAELQQGGLSLSDKASATATLSCEVLELKAAITEPFLRSPILDLSVALGFEWKDAKTGSVLARNERSERRSRKLGMGNVPSLPFGQAVVKDYGNELINDMLPRVIEKELASISFLREQR